MPKLGTRKYGADQRRIGLRIPRIGFEALDEEAHRRRLTIPELLNEMIAERYGYPLSEWQQG